MLLASSVRSGALLTTYYRVCASSLSAPLYRRSSSTPSSSSSSSNTQADTNVHFRLTSKPHPLKPELTKVDLLTNEWTNPFPHPIWSAEEVNGVVRTHVPRRDIIDSIAYGGVKMLRLGFDVFSGYAFGKVTSAKLLRRIIFLETCAGIPGFVGASLRHLKSLRLLRRDYGWVHTLLEEAENERMHMLVFKDLKRPSLMFRSCVLLAQGVFWNTFFIAYLLNPRLCHRFVGYLEEEAVSTYTNALHALDNGLLPDLAATPPPDIAIRYWRLPADATMRDVLLMVRADEANHRDVNHVFSEMQETDVNPFVTNPHTK